VFVRFAGCNLNCTKEVQGFDCDTDHEMKMQFDRGDLVRKILSTAEKCRVVVFTGGEPALQLDKKLLIELKRFGFFLAVETNGTKRLPQGLDWITVSPKGYPVVVEKAHELKYVLKMGLAIPEPCITADHLVIQPAEDIQKRRNNTYNLRHCIRLVKENPRWRLSTQLHKQWKIR